MPHTPPGLALRDPSVHRLELNSPEAGDLWKARAELIGNVAPGFTGGFAIGLDEDLPDSGRDDRLLALGHIGQ
jgi:hypothetical protein